MWLENSYWEFLGDKSLQDTLISPTWEPIQILSCPWAQNSTTSLSLVLPVTRWLLSLSFSMSILLLAEIVANFSSSVGPGIMQAFYGFSSHTNSRFLLSQEGYKAT